jgi:hypothetical protein
MTTLDIKVAQQVKMNTLNGSMERLGEHVDYSIIYTHLFAEMVPATKFVHWQFRGNLLL